MEFLRLPRHALVVNPIFFSALLGILYLVIFMSFKVGLASLEF